MHHSGARHGRGVGREGGEGRKGVAFQGAREEEHGGEEMREECGDGVELGWGSDSGRGLEGRAIVQIQWTARARAVLPTPVSGGVSRTSGRGKGVNILDLRCALPNTLICPQLRVTLRGRRRQNLRHPRRPGADGPQHPAQCLLHEDRERGAAFSDLLYYAILVILESSRFSSDLLCCLVAIVIVNSKYQLVAIAVVNSKICAREFKLL
jgi:hypothetical protein